MSNSWPDCEGFFDEGCLLDDKETDLSVADSENNPLEIEHWLKRQVGGFYLYTPQLERMWVSSIRTKRQDGLLIRFFYLGKNRTSHIVVMWRDQESLGSRLYTLPPDAITDTNRDFFFWTSWYGGPAFVEVERGPRGFPLLVLHKEKSVCIAGDFGLTKAIDKRTGDIYWLVGDKKKNYHEILFKEGPKVSEPLKCELKETPTASVIDPILQSANEVLQDIVITPLSIVIYDECKLFVKNPEDKEDHKEHWLLRTQGGFLFASDQSLGVVTSISTSEKGGTYTRVFGFNHSMAVVMWGSYGTVWGGCKLTVPVGSSIPIADGFHYSLNGDVFVCDNNTSLSAPVKLKLIHTSTLSPVMVLSKAENEKTKEIYWLIGTRPAVAPQLHMVVCIEKPKKEVAVVEPPKIKADTTEEKTAFQTIMGEVKHERLLTPVETKYEILKQGVAVNDKLEQSQTTIQKTLEDLAREVAGLRKLQVEHFNELSESIGEMYERNFSQELAEFSELMEDVSDLEDMAKIPQPFQMKDMHRLVTNTLIGMVRDAKEMSIQSFIEEFLKGASLRLKD